MHKPGGSLLAVPYPGTMMMCWKEWLMMMHVVMSEQVEGGG